MRPLCVSTEAIESKLLTDHVAFVLKRDSQLRVYSETRLYAQAVWSELLVSFCCACQNLNHWARRCFSVKQNWCKQRGSDVCWLYLQNIPLSIPYSTHIPRASSEWQIRFCLFLPWYFFLLNSFPHFLWFLSVFVKSSSLGLGILGMFALQLNPYSPRVSLRVVSFPCLISELKLLHIFPTRTSSSLMSPA